MGLVECDTFLYSSNSLRRSRPTELRPELAYSTVFHFTPKAYMDFCILLAGWGWVPPMWRDIIGGGFFFASFF